MEDEKMERAQKVYKTLCETLDMHDWKYTRDDENLSINCSAQGEDLPMEVTILVEADRQLITLFSHLPFVISEEKRLDIAIAVCMVNNKMVDGSFDYDITGGRLFFRMTNSFIESEMGNELFNYMLLCSLSTIDEFNDKFLMISKGMLTIDNFMDEN